MEEKRKLMNKAFFDMIYLINCSLNEVIPDSDRVAKMDTNAIFNLSKKHNLTAIVGHSLVACKTNDKRWEKEINHSLYRVLMFDAEREKVYAFMEKEGIWYAPLKGLVLSTLFPQPYMRQMADNDILFDKNYQSKIRDFFVSEGYNVVAYDCVHHDTYQKEPVLNFEMHTKLYNDSTKQLCEYYTNVKEKLIQDDDKKIRYHFSDNDLYIHTVSHGYKHFINTGIGIKLILDIYICLKKFRESLDFEYIEAECDKAGINEFERLAREASLKLFDSGDTAEYSNAETEFIEYCLSSGTYGNLQNYVSNTIRKNGDKNNCLGKLRYLLTRAFPPVSTMYMIFPKVKKYKILLPFAYPYRLIHRIVSNRNRVSAEIKALKELKENE